MQNFRYVMMFRHRGDQQFKLPDGYCRTSAYACSSLRSAVRFAKLGDYELMIDDYHTCEACLRALYDLTDWFPDPDHEIYKIQNLLFMLLDRSRKGAKS